MKEEQSWKQVDQVECFCEKVVKLEVGGNGERNRHSKLTKLRMISAQGPHSFCSKWPGKARPQVSRGIWDMIKREFQFKVWVLTRKRCLEGV